MSARMHQIQFSFIVLSDNTQVIIYYNHNMVDTSSFEFLDLIEIPYTIEDPDLAIFNFTQEKILNFRF